MNGWVDVVSLVRNNVLNMSSAKDACNKQFGMVVFVLYKLVVAVL